MIAYLDSSVLLRALLNQPGQLSNFQNLTRPIASKLLKPECLRSLDRLRVRGHLNESDFIKASEELYAALESIEFIEIDQRILERVGSSFPLPLGTLDAIHLASALLWRETFDISIDFLTHDEELGKVARALGFQVFGC
ncbi:MAG: type II toxin-antitoxin system VapC family toxin [Bdellovibrionia bacterium]